MKFYTEIDYSPLETKIEHTDTILTMGSCFAENIGEYFRNYKFSAMVNPFGVLYNSASIKNSIELVRNNKCFSEKDLIFHHDEWHSFFHHSDFSYHDSQEVLNKINSVTLTLRTFLQEVDWVIISLGTSFVYKHKEKKFIVSNCHKFPQSEFEKLFLDVQQNSEYLSELIDLVRSDNSKAKFIFTISPIRHWKDGAHENQLSKSSLHLALKEIMGIYDDIFYFPSYEIMMDELRDYRFYTSDMLHPSSDAIKYIWDKFSENCFSEKCTELIKNLEKIITASKHRVRNPHTKSSNDFATKNLALIKELEIKHKHLNFDDEAKIFLGYLNN